MEIMKEPGLKNGARSQGPVMGELFRGHGDSQNPCWRSGLPSYGLQVPELHVPPMLASPASTQTFVPHQTMLLSMVSL